MGYLRGRERRRIVFNGNSVGGIGLVLWGIEGCLLAVGGGREKYYLIGFFFGG